MLVLVLVMVLSLIFLGLSIYLSPALLPSGSNSARLLSGFTPPSFYSIYPKPNDCPLGFNCFKDFNKGLDDENRVGPKRASQQGYLSKYEMSVIIIIIFIICLSLGLFAFLISDFFTIILGVILFL